MRFAVQTKGSLMDWWMEEWNLRDLGRVMTVEPMEKTAVQYIPDWWIG